MKRKPLFAVGCIVSLCFGVFVACSAAGVLWIALSGNPELDQAEKFMLALKSDDYAAAFSMLNFDLTNQPASPAELERAIKDNHLQPVSWRLERDRSNYEMLVGQVTFEDGKSGSAMFVVRGTAYTMAGPTRYVIRRFELRSGERWIVFPKGQ